MTSGRAGGSTSRSTLAARRETAPALAGDRDARLYGLKGRHSGMEIHLQRGLDEPRHPGHRARSSASRCGGEGAVGSRPANWDHLR